MNTSPRFRYYLAFVLLALLSLAVRVQSVAGPKSLETAHVGETNRLSGSAFEVAHVK